MIRFCSELALRLIYFLSAAIFIVVGVTGCWVNRCDNEIATAMLVSAVTFILSYAALAIWFLRPKIEGNE